jgi:hypothetical protein
VLGGTAVGWADDTAGAGATADHSSVQTHTPSRAPRGGAAASDTTGGRGNHAPTSAAPAEQRTNGSASPSLPDALPDKLIQQVAPAAEPVAEVPAVEPATTPAVQPAPAAGSAPVVASDPVAGSAPVVETAAVSVQPAPEPVAAPAAAVAAVPTGAVTALADPLAGSNRGGVPVDTPLDWTVLAYSRRNPVSAASAVAAPQAAATASATLPLIMGPSGVPVPTTAYGNTVMDYYITPVTPPPVLPQQLIFTPEGLYPITGVKSLPLNTSVDQGLRILSDTLSKLPANSPVTVFGYSQSAIISSLLQGGYTVDINGTPTTLSVPADLANSINFVMVGDEMNPAGGFLSRFSGRGMPTLNLTSLGIPFYGATPGGPVPANGVEYPTTVYSREYDGFADFPRYPINFLSDLNAALGLAYVHVQYTPTITQAACATKAFCLTQTEVEAARAYNQLPSTSASQKYYFIPTENLPLLQPLRAIKIFNVEIGSALADLLQPALKVLVNFGYADQPHGFSSAAPIYANKLQPFDFLPPANLYGEAFKQFFEGIGQGIKDFISDCGPKGSVAQSISASALPAIGPLAAGNSGGFISSVQQVINSVTDYISGAVAGIYAALLPTADIINALVTTLPAYATNLFLYGLQETFSGNVIQGLSDAVGLPIAATVGLSTFASLVGVGVWAQGFAGAIPGQGTSAA